MKMKVNIFYQLFSEIKLLIYIIYSILIIIVVSCKKDKLLNFTVNPQKITPLILVKFTVKFIGLNY